MTTARRDAFARQAAAKIATEGNPPNRAGVGLPAHGAKRAVLGAVPIDNCVA